MIKIKLGNLDGIVGINTIKPTKFISSGNYALNGLMNADIGCGYWDTRHYEFAGDSQTGKTYLCLNTVSCATHQYENLHVLYIDTEGAINEQQLIAFDIDLDRFIYVGLSTVKDLIDVIKQAVEQKTDDIELMIIIDSLGNLISKKEREDMATGKEASDMGTRAKELRMLFRWIPLVLKRNKIWFLATNHIYEGGLYEGKKISGGRGPQYAFDCIVKLTRKKLKDGSSSFYGVEVTAKTDEKNRLARPGSVSFKIMFDKGMNPFVGLEPFLEELGIVVRVSNAKGDKYDFEINGKKYQRNKFGQQYLNTINNVVVPIKELYEIKYVDWNHPKGYIWQNDIFTEQVLDEINKLFKQRFAYQDSLYKPNNILKESHNENQTELNQKE